MPDLGAYELWTGASGLLTRDFVGTPLVGFDTLKVVLTATGAGADLPGLGNRWDLDSNGVFAVEGADCRGITHVCGPDQSTIRLDVTNAVGESATRVRSGYVYVASLAVCVLPRGIHTFPFEFWPQAATGLQGAVDATSYWPHAASEVLVTHGIFFVHPSLSLAKDIRLGSVHGTGVTPIARTLAASPMGVVTVTAPAAVLKGFTITHGASEGIVRLSATGTRAAVWMSTGVLRDCLLVGNGYPTNTAGVAQGGGLYRLDATVEPCTIVSHHAASSGGGVYMTGGSFTNTIVSLNTFSSPTQSHNLDQSASTVRFSCAPELVPGQDGNLSTDPRFRSPREGNWRLLLSSPASMRAATFRGPPEELTSTGNIDCEGRARISAPTNVRTCAAPSSSLTEGGFGGGGGLAELSGEQRGMPCPAGVVC